MTEPLQLQPRPVTLRRILSEILDLVAPPRCAGCGEFCREMLCESCAPEVEALDGPQCPRCGHPHPPTAPGWPLCKDCRDHPRPKLNGARSAALHLDPLRRAVLEFKFQGRRVLAGPLGEMLARRFDDEYARPHRLPFDDVDAIVPAVLHPSRRAWRGFDQARLLAREMSRHCGRPVWEDVLVRVKNTQPQVRLTPLQRADNMHNAFEPRKTWKLQGASVLLVDDVYTTGVTLREAARALKAGGAAAVHALTITRAAPGWHAKTLAGIGDSDVDLL